MKAPTKDLRLRRGILRPAGLGETVVSPELIVELAEEYRDDQCLDADPPYEAKAENIENAVGYRYVDILDDYDNTVVRYDGKDDVYILYKGLYISDLFALLKLREQFRWKKH